MISVLAHQNGWDEMLFVMVPLVVFAGLLVVARRRADQLPPLDAGPDDPPSVGTADVAGETDRA